MSERVCAYDGGKLQTDEENCVALHCAVKNCAELLQKLLS